MAKKKSLKTVIDLQRTLGELKSQGGQIPSHFLFLVLSASYLFNKAFSLLLSEFRLLFSILLLINNNMNSIMH